MNQIPITQQLIDYAIYDGNLNSSQARQLFFDKYNEIEDKRKRLSSSDFFQSLGKNEKIIYKTNVQLFFIRLLITFIAISLLAIIYFKLSHLIFFSSLIIILLLSIVIDRISQNFLIKKKLIDYIIKNDLKLFLKIMNRTFYNKESNEIRFNYQLFDYNSSTYNQFIVKRPHLFKEITSIKDGELRKDVYYKSKNKGLNESQALEYIALQISLCDLNYQPSKDQNNHFGQDFIDYLKNKHISLEQNNVQ